MEHLAVRCNSGDLIVLWHILRYDAIVVAIVLWNILRYAATVATYLCCGTSCGTLQQWRLICVVEHLAVRCNSGDLIVLWNILRYAATVVAIVLWNILRYAATVVTKLC